MALLTLAEAEELSEPFHSVWVEAHQRAWSMWMERAANDAEFIKDLDSSARFKIINNLVIRHVEREAGGEIIHVGSGPGLFVQRLGNRALVRFKHLNGSELRPRSYPTEQQMHLMHQEYPEDLAEQLHLDGTEPPTFLTCGYTLTPVEDAISQIVVVCHDPTLRYFYDLLEGGGAEVIEFPGIDPVAPRVISKLARDEAASDEPSGE